LRAPSCRGVAISKPSIVEIASVAEFTLSVVEGPPRNDRLSREDFVRQILADVPGIILLENLLATRLKTLHRGEDTDLGKK